MSKDSHEYPEDCRDRVVTNTNAIQAVSLNLRSFSVAFLDTTKESLPLSSGTLVCLGDHLFVATAAHCIPARPDGRLAFVTTRIAEIETKRLPYLRHGKVESGWPDVGFIEITSADALTFLGKQAIGIDRFAVQGCGDPNRPCFLYGYPAALVRTQGAQTTPDRIFTPMCYMPTPTSPERFPEVSSGDPGTDRALDIFVPYDQSENMWHFENSKGDVQLVDAPGISGGGVWQGTSREGQVWSPDTVRLIGIQSRWNQRKKYARGCQIVHWLRLIYEQYGDLRPLLSGTFPSVR